MSYKLLILFMSISFCFLVNLLTFAHVELASARDRTLPKLTFGIVQRSCNSRERTPVRSEADIAGRQRKQL